MDDISNKIHKNKENPLKKESNGNISTGDIFEHEKTNINEEISDRGLYEEKTEKENVIKKVKPVENIISDEDGSLSKKNKTVPEIEPKSETEKENVIKKVKPVENIIISDENGSLSKKNKTVPKSETKTESDEHSTKDKKKSKDKTSSKLKKDDVIIKDKKIKSPLKERIISPDPTPRKTSLTTPDSSPVKKKSKSEKGNKKDDDTSPIKKKSENVVKKDDDTSPVKKKSETVVKKDDDTSPIKKKSEKETKKDDDTSPVKKKSEKGTKKDDDTSPVKKKKSEKVVKKDDDTSPVKKKSEKGTKKDDDTSPVKKKSEKGTKKDDDTSPVKKKKSEKETKKDDDTSPVKKKSEKGSKKDDDTSPVKKKKTKKVQKDDDTSPIKKKKTKTDSSDSDTSVVVSSKKKSKKLKKNKYVEEENDIEEVIYEEDDDEVIQSRTEIFRNPKIRVAAYAVFYDGYSMRQFFEFCKGSVTSVPLCWTKKGIFINVGNMVGKKKSSFVLKTFIDKNELEDYYVDENCWNCPDEKAHIIVPDQKELNLLLKSVTKNISFVLYQYENRPDRIILKFYGDKTNDGNDFVKTTEFKNQIYNVEDGIAKDALPNCKIPLSAFSNACEKSSKLGFSHFKCFPTGLYLISSNMSTYKAGTKNSKWGSILGVDKKNFFVTKIGQQPLKNFKKLGALNPKGIIKIFSKGNGIMRFQLKMTIMNMTIFIIDPDVIDTD